MAEQRVCHWCGLSGTEEHPVKKWREIERVSTHTGYWWCVQALRAQARMYRAAIADLEEMALSMKARIDAIED
jgi:hypothetical protein